MLNPFNLHDIRNPESFYPKPHFGPGSKSVGEKGDCDDGSDKTDGMDKADIGSDDVDDNLDSSSFYLPTHDNYDDTLQGNDSSADMPQFQPDSAPATPASSRASSPDRKRRRTTTDSSQDEFAIPSKPSSRRSSSMTEPSTSTRRSSENDLSDQLSSKFTLKDYKFYLLQKKYHQDSFHL